VRDHSAARINQERRGIPSAGDGIPLLDGVELFPNNPTHVENTLSSVQNPLSSLIPMAELADGPIICLPANNRNFSRSERLVYLFLGHALWPSHHF
jgi:hypothetical protein